MNEAPQGKSIDVLWKMQPGVFHELVLLITLLLVLKLGVALAIKDPFHAVPQGREISDFAPLSVASMVPRTILVSAMFHRVVALAICVSAVCWLLGVQRRWAGVATLAALTLSLSMHYTFNTVVHHRYHMMAQLILVFAVHALIYGAKCGGDLPFWKRTYIKEAYPAWVGILCLFAICMLYTHSGISKIRVSGLGWADGAGVQTWVWSRYRGEYHGLSGLMAKGTVDNAWMARTVASLTLIAETFCVIVVFMPRLRFIFGCAILAMHAGIHVTLGILFPYNIIAVLLYFFGVQTLLERYFHQGPSVAAS